MITEIANGVHEQLGDTDPTSLIRPKQDVELVDGEGEEEDMERADVQSDIQRLISDIHLVKAPGVNSLGSISNSDLREESVAEQKYASV